MKNIGNHFYNKFVTSVYRVTSANFDVSVFIRIGAGMFARVWDKIRFRVSIISAE